MYVLMDEEIILEMLQRPKQNGPEWTRLPGVYRSNEGLCVARVDKTLAPTLKGNDSSTRNSLAKQVQLFSHSVVVHSLRPHGLLSTRLLCPWDSPGMDTGVDCHSLLQGIIPTQGSNLHLLRWHADSLPLSHQGSLV